jgi:hypothetical protein
MATTEIARVEERAVEFVPFGARDVIKITVGQIRSFIAVPTKSGKLPDDRQCVRFAMLCKARGLNPYEGDAFLIGYDGHNGPEFSLITAHQAFLKRAETHPEFDGMRSGVVVEAAFDPECDYSDVKVIRKTAKRVAYEREGDFIFDGETLLGGWAEVKFKSRSERMFKRGNLKTFEKPFGLWKNDYTKTGMVVKCVEADALRSSFPTLLGGMYADGEIGPVGGGTETQIVSSAADLNRALDATPVETAQNGQVHEDAEQDPQPEFFDPEPNSTGLSADSEPAADSIPTGEAFTAIFEGWPKPKRVAYNSSKKAALDDGLSRDDAHLKAWEAVNL